MKTSLRLSKKQNLLLSSLFIILGLSLFFFEPAVSAIVIRLCGLAVLLYGLLSLYEYLIRHVRKAKLLFYGIASFLIGILMIAMPEILLNVFPVVAGMILLISSFSQMQKAFILQATEDKGWIFDFLGAVCLMIAGLVLIVQPAFLAADILQATGILLLVEGCFNLYESVHLSNRMKALKSAL